MEKIKLAQEIALQAMAIALMGEVHPEKTRKALAEARMTLKLV